MTTAQPGRVRGDHTGHGCTLGGPKGILTLAPKETEGKVFPTVLGMFSCQGYHQIALKGVYHPAVISVRGSIYFPAPSPIPNIGKVFIFAHITDEKCFFGLLYFYL